MKKYFVFCLLLFAFTSEAQRAQINLNTQTTGTLSVSRGGTGLTSLGTATHVLRVNAAGNALEFVAPNSGIAGSTGSTDNALLRADGTGGGTLQSSAATLSDAGALTLQGDLQLGTPSTTGDKIIDAIGSVGTERLKVRSAFGQLKLSDLAGSGSAGGLVFETTYTGSGTMSVGTTASFSPNLTDLTYQVNGASTHNYRKLDATVWYQIEETSSSVTHLANFHSGASVNTLDNIFSTGNAGTNGNSGNVYLTTGNGQGTGIDGSVGLFTTSGSFGGGERVLFVANAATASSTAPTGGVILESNSAELFLRDPAGKYEVAKVLSNTATLDFASTGLGAVADLTITVTGAAVGDAVSIGVPNGSVTATATYTGWVSATNTVTIRFSPKATEDPASGTFKATVIKN